jgi:hypothetical protein
VGFWMTLLGVVLRLPRSPRSPSRRHQPPRARRMFFTTATVVEHATDVTTQMVTVLPREALREGGTLSAAESVRLSVAYYVRYAGGRARPAPAVLSHKPVRPTSAPMRDISPRLLGLCGPDGAGANGLPAVRADDCPSHAECDRHDAARANELGTGFESRPRARHPRCQRPACRHRPHATGRYARAVVGADQRVLALTKCRAPRVLVETLGRVRDDDDPGAARWLPAGLAGEGRGNAR